MEASSPNYSMSGGIQVCACNSRLLKAFHFIEGMFLNPNHCSLSFGLVFRNRKWHYFKAVLFSMLTSVKNIRCRLCSVGFQECAVMNWGVRNFLIVVHFYNPFQYVKYYKGLCLWQVGMDSDK